MMRMWFGLEIDVVGLPPLVSMFKPIYFRFHGIYNEKTTFEEFEEISEQISKE